MGTSHYYRTKAVKSIRNYLQVYGTGLLLAGLVLVVAYQFVEPAPPYSLTIATAGREGAYHAFARRYKDILAVQGITLNIQPTSGSVENLSLLKQGSVDAAFVQGGIGNSKDYPQLYGLASLYLEPLWIFTRRMDNFERISDLAGKRLAVGVEGSGTRPIALQLLRDNGLTGNNVELLSLSAAVASKGLGAGTVDALFLVTKAEARIIRELVAEADFTVMSLDRAEAYSRLHAFLSHVVIPEGVIDIQKNVPAQDIHLVAPSATMVVHENLHPALIDQLLQVVDTIHGGGSLLADKGAFPSPNNLDFPLSREAERFYQHGPPFLQKYLPFWAATLVDRLKFMLVPLLALILPLVKVLPPVYTWRIRSRIYRWYDELHELEASVVDEKSRTFGLQELDRIEDEVRKIEVPLSYDQELYSLRLHIDMLRRQLTV